MRISDWSSDVCSSDLINRIHVGGKRREMVAAKTDGRRNPADALEAADLGKNFVAPPLNLFEHLLGVRDRAFGIEPSLRLEGLVPDCSGLRFEIDRKSVVSGKSVSVRVDLGGRRIIKKKKKLT